MSKDDFDPESLGAKKINNDFDPESIGAKPLSLGSADSISKPETFGHQVARVTTNQLPAIGATIGGLTGGLAGAGPGSLPLAVAGAGLGSGLGESARQLVAKWYPDLTDAPPSALHGAAETIKQIALGAGTEAMSPLVDSMFQAVSPMIKRSAARSLRAVMDPTGTQAEGEALRASNKLLDHGGYISPTRSALERKAEAKISELSPTSGRIYREEQAVKHLDITLQPIIDGLNSLKAKLQMPPVPTVTGGTAPMAQVGASNQIKAIEDLVDHLQHNSMGQTGSGATFAPGTNISRESVLLIRKRLDKLVGAVYSKGARLNAGALSPDISLTADTEKDMSNVLRTVLNKDSPRIADLNAEFSLWKSTKDAMSPTSLKAEFPKTSSPFTDAWHARYGLWAAAALGGSGVASHAYGGSMSAGAVGAGTAVGALVAVNQLMKSTLWRTTSAALRNEIADGLAHGAYEDVAKVATRVLIQGHPDKGPFKKVTPPPSMMNSEQASQ